MGIWGNIGDRLTGALCKNLITDLLMGLPLDQIPGRDVVNGVLGQGSSGGQNVPLVGGLLGQGQGQGQGQMGKPASPQKMPTQNVPLVGGLLGGGKRKPNSPTTTVRSRFPFDF